VAPAEAPPRAVGDPRVRHRPSIPLQPIAIDRAVDLIAERIDVALRVRTQLTTDASLTMRTFGQSRRILVAAPALATAIGNARVADLANWPTLSSTDELAEIEWQPVGPSDARHTIRHQPAWPAAISMRYATPPRAASAWRCYPIMSAATISAPAASSASFPAGAARWASSTSSSPPAAGFRRRCGRLSTMWRGRSGG